MVFIIWLVTVFVVGIWAEVYRRLRAGSVTFYRVAAYFASSAILVTAALAVLGSLAVSTVLTSIALLLGLMGILEISGIGPFKSENNTDWGALSLLIALVCFSVGIAIA